MRLDLQSTIAALDEANALLSDLLGETTTDDRVGRGIRNIDLMVASGIRTISTGKRSHQQDLIIIGQVRGFVRVAIANLRDLMLHSSAQRFGLQLRNLTETLARVAGGMA